MKRAKRRAVMEMWAEAIKLGYVYQPYRNLMIVDMLKLGIVLKPTKNVRIMDFSELQKARENPLVEAIVQDRIKDIAEGRTDPWTRIAPGAFAEFQAQARDTRMQDAVNTLAQAMGIQGKTPASK